MKRNNALNFLMIFVCMSVFIACTSDNQLDAELQERELLKEESKTNSRDRDTGDYTGEIGVGGIYECSSVVMPVNEVFSFYVEWEDGLTEEEKHQIRLEQASTGYLVCVDLDFCPNNPNGELWEVQGFCPENVICKPRVQNPTHPDLRLSIPAFNLSTSVCP